MKKELKNCLAKNKLIRSFGRIKSRRLSDKKNFLLEEFLPKYEITLSSFTIPLSTVINKSSALNQDPVLVTQPSFPVTQPSFSVTKSSHFVTPSYDGVQILSQECPIKDYIKKKEINYKKTTLENEPLKNIKIFKEDIRILLEKLPQEFFDEIYILFPDPWPKSKHFKRRLINQYFLDLLSSKIRKNGKLTIATDHDSYKTWILSAIVNNNNFSWLAESKKDWQNFPSWWIETKYQKKAALEGRQSVIFNLIKK